MSLAAFTHTQHTHTHTHTQVLKAMVGAAFSVIWVYAGELLPSTGSGFRVQGLVFP